MIGIDKEYFDNANPNERLDTIRFLLTVRIASNMRKNIRILVCPTAIVYLMLTSDKSKEKMSSLFKLSPFDAVLGHNRIASHGIASANDRLRNSHNTFAVGQENSENKDMKSTIGAVLAGVLDKSG